MSIKFSDLHCKEVICISDGRRLGFISDACIEMPEGRTTAIIVPGRHKPLSLGGKEDFVIPWGCIRRMGPDIVLVDIRPEDCRVPRHKPLLPF